MGTKKLRTPRSCNAVPVFELTEENVLREWGGVPHMEATVGEKLKLENGKEAVLVYIKDRRDESVSPFVSCSCNFHSQVMNTDPNVSCMWMDKCPAKVAMTEKHQAIACAHYDSPDWKERPLSEKILDIHTRVQAGEYLGQSNGSAIYVQEVVPILQKNIPEILGACRELFCAEKLDLNGMILADYVPRFRFPKELQELMRYMIEEPVGWPNGDAGDGFVYCLEAAISNHTDHKHGNAFGKGNYPNLAPHHLASFGVDWLAAGVAGLQGDGGERRYLDAKELVRQIERVLGEAQRLVCTQEAERKGKK